MLFQDRIFYHIYPLGLCGAPERNDAAPLTESGMLRFLPSAKHGRTTCSLWDVMRSISVPCLNRQATAMTQGIIAGWDRRLGNNAGFRRWVDACHERGIKVVVDGVFNHTGREFPAFKNLREKKWDSWGKDWYCQVNFDGTSPLGDDFWYESWRGYPELPRLNVWNPKVADELMDVVRFWIENFDIDGIRLDCADVLDFEFMRRLRRETESMKPDFWLMGEVIHGDYGRWVAPGMLHSVTNYELHKGIYSAHNSHNYFEMAHTLRAPLWRIWTVPGCGFI